MWKLFRPEPLPVALEISGDRLRLMQLASDRGALRVVAALSRRLNAGPGQRAHEIRRALQSAEFTTHDAVISLPTEIVHLRTIRIPVVEPAQIESIVREDSDRQFLFDLTTANVQWINAGVVRQAGQDRLEIIAAAARNDDVAAFFDEIQSAGLRVRSTFVAPLAAFTCAQRHLISQMPGESAGASAVVEIGASHTTVTIARPGAVAFMKRIEIGGRHLNDAVAQKLNLTPDEVAQLRRKIAADADRKDDVSVAVFTEMRGLLDQLARDVEACFRYFSVTFRGRPPARISLLGAEAFDPRLQAALSAVLPGKVEAVDPLAGIDLAAMRIADQQDFHGAWTTCAGISISAMNADLKFATPLSARDARAPGISLKAILARAIAQPAKSAVATAALGVIAGSGIRMLTGNHLPASSRGATTRQITNIVPDETPPSERRTPPR